MTTVVYDFLDRSKLPADAVDGSDEMLRPEDRVTEADRVSPLSGAVRRAQDEIRRRKRDR